MIWHKKVIYCLTICFNEMKGRKKFSLVNGVDFKTSHVVPKNLHKTRKHVPQDILQCNSIQFMSLV